jgi:hypothetical protein
VEKPWNDGENAMSKTAQAAAKADLSFEEYLAMGSERSIHKLAAYLRGK